MNKPLYSDDKTLEDLEVEVFLDQSSVVFNLMEDILCLKEGLDRANNLLCTVYDSGIQLAELEEPIHKYLVGDMDD